MSRSSASAGTERASASSNRGLDFFARSGSPSPVAIWAVSTAICFLVCAIWAIVTPIGAANDESAQVLKAVSTVRGQLIGKAYTPEVVHSSSFQRSTIPQCNKVATSAACDRPVTVVHVPQGFSSLPTAPCYSYPYFPASGCKGLHGSGRSVLAATYVGRYPPLYYILVGLPSLAESGDAAVYLMRLLSCLACTVFVGAALALAVAARRWALALAVSIATTPMVFIFGSAVNPSGLEMATALCLWTGGALLVLDYPEDPPPYLVVTTAVAACVFVLIRGLSPLWLVTIGIFLVLLSPRSIRTLSRSRAVRIAGAAVAASLLVAAVYVLWADALAVLPVGAAVRQGVGTVALLEQVVGHFPYWFDQFVGTFGSAYPPLPVIAAWVVVASALVVGCLVTSPRRHVLVLCLLGIVAAALPVVLVSTEAHRTGIVWQARDGYPLYVGILIVAGAALAPPYLEALRQRTIPATDGGLRDPGSVRRMALLVAGAITFVQFGNLIWALRRYRVGLGNVANPFADLRGAWNPPISAWAIAVLALATCSAYGWWIYRTCQISARTDEAMLTR